MSLASPELAVALMRGKVDVAFMRREAQCAGLTYKFLVKEPLLVVMPKGHRLATSKWIQPKELVREIFIRPAPAAPVLRGVIDEYAKRVGITLTAAYEGENLSAVMSLVASTGGLALAPFYAKENLTAKVVARPLQGETPAIDLVIGYSRSNTSALLKKFLGRANELAISLQKQVNAK